MPSAHRRYAEWTPERFQFQKAGWDNAYLSRLLALF
jgi:hypothetical protein